MMKKAHNLFVDLWYEEDGATAVEYVILLVLIIVVVITAVGILGDKTSSSFNKFNDEFTKAAGTG